MSDLKQRALALYKPPFSRVHGYIYDADSRVVADDAAAKDEEAALRIRGWGRIQYLVDPEALQDAAGDLIAEALTEYWQRRTQPEATAPAQDQQLVVATSTETGFFHVVISLNDGKRMLVLYDKQHSLNGDTVGVADVPAAALASSASALSAGDSEHLTEVAVKAYTQFAAKASYLRHPEVPYMGTAKGDHPDRWKERFDKAAMRSVVCAILQSQKDSHG